MSSNTVILAISYVLVLMLAGFARSDFNQERNECADQLVGLAPCLQYVGGEAHAPTLDCCSGFKQIIGKSKKCLCILLKDRDNPNLGFKINATLAATLPTACHAPANVTECINILHLPPNSPDAKVFAGFANITKGTRDSPVASGNSTGSGSSGDLKSGGGRADRWLGFKMTCGFLLWVITSLGI